MNTKTNDSTKKHRPHIPTPKILRIEQRHLAGERDRQIARTEHCSRNTVARIVKAPELQAHLQQIRERIWGVAEIAADVVRDAIVVKRDAKISYQLLRDIGVLPRATQIVLQPQLQQVPQESAPLTPFESAMLGLAAIAEQTSETYGVPLPNPQEMKHNLEIAQEVDRMTNGKALSISLNDSTEWSRLAKLAAERLKDARK